jgi:hypothetical protein
MAGLGDLFGRPPFRKAVADEGPQPVIFFEDGFTPPAQLVGTRHRARREIPKSARRRTANIVPKEL